MQQSAESAEPLDDVGRYRVDEQCTEKRLLHDACTKGCVAEPEGVGEVVDRGGRRVEVGGMAGHRFERRSEHEPLDRAEFSVGAADRGSDASRSPCDLGRSGWGEVDLGVVGHRNDAGGVRGGHRSTADCGEVAVVVDGGPASGTRW